MVLGELDQLTVTVEIRPAVAHLPDEEPRAEQHERRDCGAHAALVVLGARTLENRAVRGPDGGAHPVRHLLVHQALPGPELARPEAPRHLTRPFPPRLPP